MKRAGQRMIPMNISEASQRGYEFHLTDGRLAFRTPYGQPDAFRAQVSGKSNDVEAQQGAGMLVLNADR